MGPGVHPRVSAALPVRRFGVERSRHERLFDDLGWITQVKTTVGGSVVALRGYTHNAANQRELIKHEDGRAWFFGYDSLGQVTSAEKRLSNHIRAFGWIFRARAAKQLNNTVPVRETNDGG
jgi:YD repeat-containing protein